MGPAKSRYAIPKKNPVDHCSPSGHCAATSHCLVLPIPPEKSDFRNVVQGIRCELVTFRCPWTFAACVSGLLEALIRPIRPLELDCVFAQLLGLPGADIADLSVGVIVPTLAGDRIGDRFAKLVGTR